MTMSRRQFVGLSFSAALATCASEAALAYQPVASTPGWTLYDPRFIGTAAAAMQLNPSATPRAIGSDITELMQPLKEQLRANSRLAIHGITTDTIPFGLQQLIPPPHRVALQLSRFDRDLFVWQLHITQGT